MFFLIVVAVPDYKLLPSTLHHFADGEQASDISSSAAVEVYNLSRRFSPGWLARFGYRLRRFFLCYGLRTKKQSAPQRLRDFWAIKGSWFGIEPDQLFCLLGPNGAGKTTTINCLTGGVRGAG